MNNEKVAAELIRIARELTAVSEKRFSAKVVISQPVDLRSIAAAFRRVDEIVDEIQSEMESKLKIDFTVKGQKTNLWANSEFEKEYRFEGDRNSLTIWREGKLSFSEYFDEEIQRLLRRY